MNNPFNYTPDPACQHAFEVLLQQIELLKGSPDPSDIRFCRELDEGKMLGVLIADDGTGHRRTLYAFSGQIAEAGFYHEGFVGPVFGYLEPDGYFRTQEARISRLNKIIADLENTALPAIRNAYDRSEQCSAAKIEKYRNYCRQAKLERDRRRNDSHLTATDQADMIRQSQFEKAELHRLKKRMQSQLQPLENKVRHLESVLKRMRQRRKADSEALQKWLFDNFKVLNAQSQRRSLSHIFDTTTFKTPPSGAGECCAPKLLQAAYINGWTPLAMAEYWYGKSKHGEVRRHGHHYPACRGKCLPVLTWMLRGLPVYPALEDMVATNCTHEPEIIFENDWFCVVNKPAGLLSVPGKGNTPSVEQWLQNRYGEERNIKMAHRLDQDTSGLIIATFGHLTYKLMQSLFARREISKTYVALLEGDYTVNGLTATGSISLPLRPDPYDRPRQVVDFEAGKEGLTDYSFISVMNTRSRIEFHPHTGRTHQLRVHAAAAQGLNMPIVGDRLYGHRGSDNDSRLMLHAHKIEFIFPIDGRHYRFESPLPF